MQTDAEVAAPSVPLGPNMGEVCQKKCHDSERTKCFLCLQELQESEQLSRNDGLAETQRLRRHVRKGLFEVSRVRAS